MNTHLALHFHESLQSVHGLFQGFPVNENPLEMRIAPLLYEQQSLLQHALSLLQHESIELKEFRSVISVIYRSNESFDPIYRGWIRASRWMESVHPELLQKKKSLSNNLRHHLINAVPYIQQIYGENDTRYIVPPLYRYKMKLMDGVKGGV